MKESKQNVLDYNKSESSFNELKIIFGSIWKDYKRWFMAFIALSFFAALLATISPQILRRAIDLLSNKDNWNTQTFLILLSLYALCLILTSVFKFFSDKMNFYFSTRIEDKWRYSCLRHFYNLPFTWHDQQDSGETAGKINEGGSAIFTITQEILGNQLFISTMTLIMIIAYTFWKYPLFGFLFLLPLPFYLLVSYKTADIISKKQHELNKLARMAWRTFYDGVANFRSVKAFGKEKDETKRYSDRWGAYHALEYKMERYFFTRRFLQTFIEMTMRAVVLGFAVYYARNGLISVGEVVLIMSYQEMIFAPMTYLNQVFTRMRRNIKRTAHLFEILSEEDTLRDHANATDIGPLKKGILVENVGFVYSAKIPALKKVSLNIPVGTTTALVGKSGSGKTTLALLLMRFYDPSSGKITFDSRDIKDIKRSSLRDHIAWIPQDTSLFNRSIKENIAYGNSKASMKEIIEAAKLAHSHDFIMATKDGYNSVIGERGVKLSGGQRQRIAIARALLKKPSVLILDEATSHLDSETEKAIKESIKNLHHKTTLVIIAHRLSTILHADQIAVMDKGEILEVKRHKDLLKSSKIYKAFYDIQFHKDE